MMFFKVPESKAIVKYLIKNDLFVGGTYLIQAKNEDDLIRVSSELKDVLDKQLDKKS